MFIKSIFLFLPIIAQAEISLRINAYAENKVDFDYKGANIDVIAGNERQTFGKKLVQFVFVIYHIKYFN